MVRPQYDCVRSFVAVRKRYPIIPSLALYNIEWVLFTSWSTCYLDIERCIDGVLGLLCVVLPPTTHPYCFLTPLGLRPKARSGDGNLLPKLVGVVGRCCTCWSVGLVSVSAWFWSCTPVFATSKAANLSATLAKSKLGSLLFLALNRSSLPKLAISPSANSKDTTRCVSCATLVSRMAFSPLSTLILSCSALNFSNTLRIGSILGLSNARASANGV
mmetsp:Transcript_53732/g.80170  ORF Transcript_53732/g.80170 Transcript_53732/m.80170 type:complete len:216 (-) Transcript_53732:1618-2265(-)